MTGARLRLGGADARRRVVADVVVSVRRVRTQSPNKEADDAGSETAQ